MKIGYFGCSLLKDYLFTIKSKQLFQQKGQKLAL